MRLLLYPLSWLYGLVVGLRNFFYDRGWLRSFQFDFPVVLVGNLSTGGTGKTPHVLAIARILSSKYRVAVLSRGYKRKTRGYIASTELSLVEDIGDEPKLMKQRMPELEVAVCENRLMGISELLQEEPPPNIILMDDGFQHRKVRAGLNIILTDYSKLFTKDHLLPVGRLREPRSSLRRADVIIVTKCPPDMSKREAAEMRTTLHLLPLHKLFFTAYKYAPLKPLLPDQMQTEPGGGHGFLVVCALASNQYLKDHLQSIRPDVKELCFPDHHYYKAADMQKIKQQLDGDRLLVTTEKDAVKLMEIADDIRAAGLSFFVLPVEVEFLFEKAEKFAALIDRYVKDAKSVI